LKKGLSKAAKKSDRETGDGLVSTYIHAGGKIGAMVELACETDFVAKTEDFEQLAREIAMQIASMKPEKVEDLLAQSYIRDPKKTIEELVKETIAKVGENIKIKRFCRMEINQEAVSC
jgi:elongation factor Ts